jgi:TetR/AcrR family transcriptional regulator, transcriptional repressor for nem operon
LLDWVTQQFQELGTPDPAGHAITLVGAYQGMSVLASALRDPQIMTQEGTRLAHWLDTLHTPQASRPET